LHFACNGDGNILQNKKREEEMIKIEVNETRVRCVSGGEMLTWGCVGIAIKVAFSPEGRGFIKTAIVYGILVWGNVGYGAVGTAVQYPLFARSMRQMKKRNGCRNRWWLLSIHASYHTLAAEGEKTMK
jgi:hypothetical protein